MYSAKKFIVPNLSSLFMFVLFVISAEFFVFNIIRFKIDNHNFTTLDQVSILIFIT